MADNFDLKQFLFENKLGAYSKAVNPVNEEQLKEEAHDLKRDLIGVLGPNPTVDDVAKHLNKSYDEAEFLMKRLGMGLYKSSSAPRGGFRQSYPSSQKQQSGTSYIDKIVNRVRMFNYIHIDNYKFKKDKRTQAEEALKTAIANIVDKDSRISQENRDKIKRIVLSKILQPIKDQQAKYAKEKAAQSSAPQAPKPGDQPQI